MDLLLSQIRKFHQVQYFHRVIKAGFLDVLGSPFRSELTNTGSKAFKTVQYTHNFLAFNRQQILGLGSGKSAIAMLCLISPFSLILNAPPKITIKHHIRVRKMLPNTELKP
jgi:hypothetical protein